MSFKYMEVILSKYGCINHIYWFVMILFFINTFLQNKYSKKTTQKNLEKIKFNFLSNAFIIFALLVVFSIVLSIKPLLIFMNIISILFLIYLFIIIPLLDIKQYNPITSQEQLSLSLFFLNYIYILINKNIVDFLTRINNEYLIQFATIVSLFIFLFFIIYVILINMYWFMFYINELFFKNLYHKMDSILDKYNISKKLDTLFEQTSDDYKNNIKTLLFSILKIIKMLFIEFIFFTIIRILMVFTKCLISITYNSDYITYRLSKLSLLLAMFITYILIQINNTFSPNIIDIFELVITSTIIPIVIEKLINNSLTKKQESNVK